MGKSVLLHDIIKSLWKKFHKVDDAIAITTSTSITMYNVGGVTLHSFGSFGPGIETTKHLPNKIRGNTKVRMHWLRTQVSFIDEGGPFLSLQVAFSQETHAVSMVEGDLFHKLEHVVCIMCKNTKPFRGIPLIVTGDFFQLPPVTKGGQVKFTFEAQLWNECI